MDESRAVEAIVHRAFPGARIEWGEPLDGGISARAIALDLRLSTGEMRRVVVRRPSHPTRALALASAQAEYRALHIARAVGVRVPAVHYLDESVPALVLGYVEGAPELSPSDVGAFLEQMAAELVRIHTIAVPERDRVVLPLQREIVGGRIREWPDTLDASLDEARLRRALDDFWPWPAARVDSLLHGDYWPGNLLWQRGRLAAVIDWEEAAIGDPLADLAIARLDVLWVLGRDAMHQLTRIYLAQSNLDPRALPYWDLYAALRPMSRLAAWAPAYAQPALGRQDVTEAHMRAGHQAFVEQAMFQLDRLDRRS